MFNCLVWPLVALGPNPYPTFFYMSILLAWNFKVLLLHKSQKQSKTKKYFLGLWHTRLNEHSQNEKKILVSWIGIFNLEVILSTFKGLHFHNSFSITFQASAEKLKRVYRFSVQGLRISLLLNETMQHFTLICPLKFSQ